MPSHSSTTRDGKGRGGRRRAARRGLTAALAAAAGLAALALPGPAEAEVWDADFDSVRVFPRVWGFNGEHADHTGLKSFTYRGETYDVLRLWTSGDGYANLRFDLDKPVPDELVLAISADAGNEGTSAVSVNTSDGRKSNGGNRLDFVLPHGMKLFDEEANPDASASMKVVLSDFSPFSLRRPVIVETTSPSDTSMQIAWELQSYSKFHPERHIDGWLAELRHQDGATRRVRIADFATTTHTFSGLTTGDVYYVRVRPRFTRTEFQTDAWHRWSQYAKKVAGSPNPVLPDMTEFPDDAGAPRLDLARPGYVKANGTEMVLNFTENIRPAMRTTDSNGVQITMQDLTRPAPDLFTVTAGGAGGLVTFEQIFITTGTRQILLMGASPTIPQGGTVRVSYTDPNPGVDDSHEDALNDWAGSDIESFTQVALDNRSTQAANTSAGPTPVHAFYEPGDDDTIYLEFDKAISNTDFPSASTFTLTIGTSEVSVTTATRVSANDKRVALDFGARPEHRALPATVSYAHAGGTANRLKGTDGTNVADFTVPVRNDRGVLTFSVSDVTVREAPGATATFTVRLSPAWHEAVTVNYATVDDTATAGEDYTAASGTLTFAAGDTSKSFAVSILDDDIEDSGETFHAVVNGATGPRFATYRYEGGTGTVTNDEIEKPRVTGVAVLADDSGDGLWSAGEAIAVRLDFSEAVTVSGGRPTVDIAFAGIPVSVPLFYASGSGSESLVFSERVLEGEFTGVELAANSLNLRGAGIASLANGTAAALEHPGTGETEETETETESETEAATPLTAAFTDVPASHGGDAFTLELAFSEEFPLSYKLLQGADGQASVVAVEGGAVTRAARVTAGESRRWTVTVEPDGSDDVTLTLPATTDCEAEGAICTEDDRPLAAAVAATVPNAAPVDTQVEDAPFTVRFAGLPASHDGAGAVTFEVHFSDEPQGYSYRTLRDETLSIAQGGTAIAPTVKRIDKPSNLAWTVTVEPGSKADLAIAIAATADCAEAGAVCNEDGEPLSAGAAATIPGPPGLAVADARVEEAAGATVDFAVTLSRAASETVTVDYATADGSATAGDDYSATSGTLSFAPGETAKTVSVPVLDDAHDEGEESFTLTLSNVSGGDAWLRDAEATGTIANTDAMPQAWLARFGRTVAEQVIDAVEARFSTPRSAGIEVSVAGRELSGVGLSLQEPAAPGEGNAAALLLTLPTWFRDEGEGGEGPLSRALSERDFLTGSSFALTGGTADAGYLSVWGRGAVSRFDGREGELALDGEVTSAMLGGDFTHGLGLVGLMLTHSRGAGSYRSPSAEGEVESTLTGLYPYGRFAVNDRVTVWGGAGYGTGSLTLKPKDQAPLKTDMELTMGAVGLRGVAVEAPAEGGLELSIASDAMAVQTSSDAVRGRRGNLAGASADVLLLRLGVEGTWRGLDTGGGSTLVPTAEIGVRHDSGDAETGFGLDAGVGLSWSDPANGLGAELRARGLLTHQSDGFRNHGLAGSLSWSPGQGSGRGPLLALTQTVGAPASGGMDALFGQSHLDGLAASHEGDALEGHRTELRMGYGFSVLGGRFTAMPEVGLGLSDSHRQYTIGWRLDLVDRETNALELEFKLEAMQRERTGANDDTPPEYGIRFGLTARH